VGGGGPWLDDVFIDDSRTGTQMYQSDRGLPPGIVVVFDAGKPSLLQIVAYVDLLARFGGRPPC